MSVSAAVKKRVGCWLSGIVNEMRKKSPASIQKWVDSIADDDVVDESRLTSNETTIAAATIKEEEILDDSKICDENDDDASTSLKSGGGKNENLKVKLNEICNKFNVNETLKSKKTELKNLISKTTLKLKRETTLDENHSPMEQTNDQKASDKQFEPEIIDEGEEEQIKDTLNTPRAHIALLGRSSSENPNPKHKRLSEIGRSFSVTNESDLPNNRNDPSSENLIYDADEDISITLPSPNLSSTTISASTNQNLLNSERRRSSLLQIKPAREHTVSEGHASPLIQPKNPLLRDSSFQVSEKYQKAISNKLN